MKERKWEWINRRRWGREGKGNWECRSAAEKDAYSSCRRGKEESGQEPSLMLLGECFALQDAEQGGKEIQHN